MANQNQQVIAQMEATLADLEARFGDEREDDQFTGDDGNRAQMEMLRNGIAALRAAAPPIFNRHDMEDILDGLADGLRGDRNDGDGLRAGGKPKLEKLMKRDADSWRAWRTHATLVIQENEWDNDRAKRMLKMSLFDAAERITRDIMPIPAAERIAVGEDEETYTEFLNKLQLRFLPNVGAIQG